VTGPEHYREAEKLIADAANYARPNDEGHCEADRALAEAQVHATLALVAAYALCAPISGQPSTGGHPSSDHYEDWLDVVDASVEEETR
jgi:hypothetical protein